MSWVMIDDEFADHPKFCGIGDDGLALWVRALAYSNKKLTDGRVPTDAVPLLSRSKKPFDVAKKLVDARAPGSEHGLWEVVDGGYQIHDFHDFQPSAAMARAKRAEVSAKRVESGRLGAAKRWGNGGKPDGKVDSKPDGEAMATAEQTPGKLMPPFPVTHSALQGATDSGAKPPDPIAGQLLAELQLHRHLAGVATVRFTEELLGSVVMGGKRVEDARQAIRDAAIRIGAIQSTSGGMTIDAIATLVSKYVSHARRGDAAKRSEPSGDDGNAEAIDGLRRLPNAKPSPPAWAREGNGDA